MNRSTLRDSCERIDYGLTAAAVHSGGGPKFLRITDIDASFVDWSKVPRCNANEADAAKYALRSGDIVIARTGASTGRSQWIEVDEPAVFASYLVRFRAKPEVDSHFLGYVLTSQPWQEYVSSVAHSKSAQPNMSAADMANFSFACPPLSQQQAIAEVLGALDDKIAFNAGATRTNDEMSASLFKWMSSSAEPISLSSTARFINGRAFTKGASGTGRVVIRIAELNSGIGGSTVFNDIDVPEQHLARPGDILFAWSGSLTLHRWYRPEGIINQHIFKVMPKEGYPTWLVWQLITHQMPWFKSIAADKATTMGHIQRAHLDAPVPVPPASAIAKYDALMSALWDRALAAERESLTLATLRDTLLPALMSGRLRVRDAEKIVGDAT